MFTATLTRTTNGVSTAGRAASPAVTTLPAASIAAAPMSQPRPLSRSKFTRVGTRHASLYACAIATAKLLPTQTRPTMPITLATRALSLAALTASVTTFAAVPVTPSQLTMSSATWSLPDSTKPTMATASTARANSARKP